MTGDVTEGSATAAPALLSFGGSRGRWVLAATVLGSGMAFIDAHGRQRRPAHDRRGAGRGRGRACSGRSTATRSPSPSLILLGGSLGDRFGRRRVFVIGVVWFAVASLLCGVAPNVATAHRGPRAAGRRRRAADAGQPGDPAGVVPLRGPGARDRRLVRAGRHRRRGRPVPGRLAGADASGWRWVFLINLPLRRAPSCSSRSGTSRRSARPAGLALPRPARAPRSAPLGLGCADLRADRLAGARADLSAGAADPGRRRAAGWPRSCCARALRPGPDAAAGHLLLAAVQRDQRGDLRRVRRARRASSSSWC